MTEEDRKRYEALAKFTEYLWLKQEKEKDRDNKST